MGAWLLQLFSSFRAPGDNTGAKGQVSVIPALGRLRQEDCKFEPSPGHIARLSKQKQGYVEFGELMRDVAPGGNAYAPYVSHTILENGEQQHSSAGISMSTVKKPSVATTGARSVVLGCSVRPLVAVSQIL